MPTNYIRIEDADNNWYYPHTDISVVNNARNESTIINRDFKIWQRYDANKPETYTLDATGKYIADRWFVSGTGTFKPNDYIGGGAEIIGTCRVRYFMLRSDFDSLGVNITIRYATDKGVFVEESDSTGFTILSDGNVVFFDKTFTDCILYSINDSNTLPLTNYADELGKCVYYYEFVNGVTTLTTSGASYRFSPIYYARKRINPTIDVAESSPAILNAAIDKITLTCISGWTNTKSHESVFNVKADAEIYPD